jgi:hypothetical protein
LPANLLPAKRTIGALVIVVKVLAKTLIRGELHP